VKILLASTAQKDILALSCDHKRDITSTLDLMQSVGQLGKPLDHERNIWVFRKGQVRFIYHRVPLKQISILRVVHESEHCNSSRL